MVETIRTLDKTLQFIIIARSRVTEFVTDVVRSAWAFQIFWTDLLRSTAGHMEQQLRLWTISILLGGRQLSRSTS